MNDMQIFDNSEFGAVRTLEENGKILLSGSDVARVLGYSNPWDALKRHCLADGVVKREGVSQTTNQHGVTTDQVTEMTFITEGNVYRLITHSKLPSAMRFEHWVFDEILPSIRRHGAYATDEVLNNPDVWIAALQELKTEREKRRALELENAQNRQLICEMRPKASYYDMILQNKSTVPVSQIAKDYGMSGQAFNKLLHELGVQFKMRNCWLLYQDYADQGYTQSRTHVIDTGRSVMHTYWTQKGRLFIYDLLKSKRGLIPVIERSAA